MSVYGKFGIFPLAYSDVIGLVVTHGGPGWNRNTFLLLLRKFLLTFHLISFLFCFSLFLCGACYSWGIHSFIHCFV